MSTRTLQARPVLAILLLAVLALSLSLALPAQAQAAPSETKAYTVGDASYRPSKDGDAWYALVVGCKDPRT